MSPPDALREALGQVIADQRREWRRERELIEAQSRQVVAELRAQIVELQAELRAKVDARLAEVKDGEPGRSVALADVEPLIAAAVTRAVDGIPRAKDGASVTIEQIAPLIDESVARAVAAVPPAEPGAPGSSVTKDDVAPMIAMEVDRAVAAIPPVVDGRIGELESQLSFARTSIQSSLVDIGKRIDDLPPPPDLAPLEAEIANTNANVVAVVKRVDALPAPPTVADVKEVIASEVRAEIDHGQSVADAIAANVAKAVAALPPAKEGPPGKLPVVEVWTDRVYQEGDAVSFEGATYQAVRLTGKPPSHDDWRCIVLAGRNGNDGRSLNPRSTWSATETYAALDVVALDGGFFVARRDDPGPCPGDGWQLMAGRGKPGRPGSPGDRGKPGPAVIDCNIDSTGMFTLVNADGTTLERDFAPVLAQLAR